MIIFTKEYIAEMLQFLVFIPAGILCFLPVLDRLKIPVRRLVIFCAVFFAAAALICPWLKIILDQGTEPLFMALVILAFILYVSVLDCPFEISTSIFLLTMLLMTFPSNLSIAIDAKIHPYEDIDDVCLLAPSAQLIISLIFLAVFSPLFYHQLRRLTEMDQIRKPWIMISTLILMFLVINIYIQPQKYETLHVNRMFHVYVISQFFFLGVMLLLYGIFYLIMKEIQNAAAVRIRLRYLEMQESQYALQQHYIEETSRIRHDFRQQIHTLAGMAEKKDYEELTAYLKTLSELQPQGITKWCENVPVNALLNHYASQMEEDGIRLNWSIRLPDDLSMTDVELCSLLGNILENADHGCLTVSENERFHDLMIRTENTTNLYIVSVNSFDGKVRKKDDTYLSTKRDGSGIGLQSISSIAGKYDGFAKASHEGRQFTIDVALPGIVGK